MLKQKLGTEVQIGKVDFRPFSQILLRDVFIEDLNHDTLLSAQTLKASLFWVNQKNNILKLNKVGIEGALINFYTDSSGVMNLNGLLDKLSTDTSTTSTGEPMGIEINNIFISNSTFRLKDFNPPKVEYGINFSDLTLNQLNLDIKDFGMHGDTISMAINHLNFTERSGFYAQDIRAEFSMSSRHLEFDKLRVKAEGANLQLPLLKMKFDGWDKLGDFFNSVFLDVDIRNSFFTSQMLAYFVPELKDYNLGFTLSGLVKGPLADVQGRKILLTMGSQTVLLTNFNISGLPDIDQTMMNIDVKEFSSSLNDIRGIKLRNGEPLVSLPENLTTLKKVTYKGNFTGFPNNFVAFGTISTAIGKIRLDLSIKPDVNQSTEFNGKISVDNADLGKIAGTASLGKTSLVAMVKGKSDKKANISAFTDATIFKIEANDYRYSNIRVSGNLTNRTYVGSISLDDPNCKLNFLGKVDFSDSIPVFDFSAFVPKIDLKKLNLNPTDSISQASFLLTAKFRGNNLDNSKGEIKVVNSFYKNQNGEFKLADITINADNNADSKVISLKSEFAEGELRGKYNYANIIDNLLELMYIYVPALKPEGHAQKTANMAITNPEFNDYIIKFRLKKTQKITNVIAPEFKIAENTSVFGIFNPDLQTLTLKIKIPEVASGANVFKDISIDGQTKDSIFEASVTSPLFDIGGTYIKNLNLTSLIKQNKIDFTFAWDNKQSIKNLGEIKAIADFNPSFEKKGSIATLEFKPCNFIINDSTWSISPSKITIDTSTYNIDNLIIQNQKQSLSIHGNISKYGKDSLLVKLKNIDISNLNFYSQSIGYKLKGRINGYAMVSGIFQSPTLFADIDINDMAVNSREVGHVNFSSNWFNEEKRLALNLTNTKHDTVTFNLMGNLFTETNKLDFKVKIQQIQLAHLAPFLEGNVSNMTGSLNGNLKVTGTTEKPLVNGTIFLNKSRMTLDFLKTRYAINDHIDFINSDIFFKNFKILDIHNKTAVLNGKLSTEYFSNFMLDLGLNTDNFQCMNTKEKDNELFYGTVYATGQINITGPVDNLTMNVAVRTEPKTALFLPLPSGGDVAENNFIKFASNNPDDILIEETIIAPPEQSSNMQLNFDLQVTPEAEVQIIIDKKLGDIIKASGSGNLKMEVNPYTDDFKMYGDYIIEKGDYLFTLQGVINKKFKIEEGGSISWNGDPIDATMNIKAVYKVKTGLDQLLMLQDDRYKQKVPVDCQILLTQKLMAPGIKFNIDVLTTDNETKALVNSALSTEESINKNFLSLLVINSFVPTFQDQNSPGLSSGLSNTVSEMLSNQLSNWLSQWSKTFDIGLNYRPGSPNNELSSDQVELALSTQLFNDRVSINGNVDMGSRSTSSPIAGDFNMDVKLNKSGKLRFKAFARSNDELIKTEQNQYTTGAGILYREEFNNLYDLLHRVKHTFKEENTQIPLKDEDQNKSGKDIEKKTEKEDNFVLIK